MIVIDDEQTRSGYRFLCTHQLMMDVRIISMNIIII